jgi:hypothetical protein
MSFWNLIPDVLIIMSTVLFVFSVMNVDGSCGFMIVDHIEMTTLFIYSTF